MNLKAKKIIGLLTGIIMGLLFGCGLIAHGSSAHSKNVKVAAHRMIERYPETGILPSVGLGIFITESGGGHNNGRYYGNMSRRIWDVVDSTDQFLALMKRYGNVNNQKSCYGQLCALQGHGYYGGSSAYYISYVFGVIEREGFIKFDKRAKRRLRRLERKRKQKQAFTLAYDPALRPWEVVTYRGCVKRGTIKIDSESRWRWLDVVKTKRGTKGVIYTGNLEQVMMGPVVKLEEVCEGAVG